MKTYNTETDFLPKCLILGLDSPRNRTLNMESYFEEFLNLVKTNGVLYEKAIFMRLREVDNAYYLTKGKLQELKVVCDELEIKHLIVSEQLSPQQERNLSDFLDCVVFDRTDLILEIFEKAAQTAEGKLQVKLAMLKHRRARLAGKGVFLAQQAGMIGVRGGPGETLKERETRLIDEEVLKIKRELSRIERARATQRKQRQKARVPHLCLIGYTNAGKSTLLNALTKSDVLAEDKLFATLDTTTRELYINSTKIGVLSDTVGFIQNLPHTLIEAFKSTLSELQYADLLVQVIDISDANWEKHIEVVHTVLEELNLHKNMLYVFNKSDKLSSEYKDIYLQKAERYQPHVITSAQTKEGLESLKEFLYTWHAEQNSN